MDEPLIRLGLGSDGAADPGTGPSAAAIRPVSLPDGKSPVTARFYRGL